MIPPEVRNRRENVRPPRRWGVEFAPPASPDPPYPYSNQEILRRRAEAAQRAYMQSQTNTFLDPGINPAVRQRIRDEYNLPHNEALEATIQAAGAAVGAFSGAKKTATTGASIGAFAGPKGAAVGGVIGAISGAITGGFTGAAIGGLMTPTGMAGGVDLAREMILDATKNPVGGAMQASQRVGNTIGQLKGIGNLRSAILTLQDDGDLIDNLRRSYGAHEEGFTRLDFSRIRKNMNIDLPFGNAIIDFIGEMTLDPVNWENNALKRISATVTDGSVVILGADSANDEFLQMLGVGDMKKIGEFALDSIHDPYEAKRQFANMVRSNPELREHIMKRVGTGQGQAKKFEQYVYDMFDTYSNRIIEVLQDTEADYFKKVASGIDAAEQNLNNMRQLTGDPDFGYDQLSSNLRTQFKRHGFDFKAVHMDKLKKQYPALKRSIEVTDLQNKWLMRIGNPVYSAGTEGIKKLIDYIRSGSPRKFLVDHFSSMNQGRTPFIDIDDKDGIVSIKPTKQYSNKQKQFKQLAEDINERKEQEYKQLQNLQKDDPELKKMYDQLRDVKQKSASRKRELDKQVDDLYSSFSIYSGDEFVDDIKADMLKEELKGLIKIESPDQPTLKRIEELNSLLQTHQNIKNYQEIDNNLVEHYTNVQQALDQTQVIYRRFEEQWSEERARVGASNIKGFKSWLQDQEEYKEQLEYYMNFQDALIGDLEESIGEFEKKAKDADAINMKTKLKQLKEHPARKILRDQGGSKPIRSELFQDLHKQLEKENIDFYDPNSPYVLPPQANPNHSIAKTGNRVLKHLNTEAQQNFDKELKQLGIDGELIRHHQRIDYDPVIINSKFADLKTDFSISLLEEDMGTVERENLYNELIDNLQKEIDLTQKEFDSRLKHDSDATLRRLSSQYYEELKAGNSDKVKDIYINLKEAGLEPDLFFQHESKRRLLESTEKYLEKVQSDYVFGNTENVNDIVPEILRTKYGIKGIEVFDQEVHDALLTRYMENTFNRGVDHRPSVAEQFYPGDERILNDIDIPSEDIEKFFKEIYGKDIEELVTKRTGYLKYKMSAVPMKIDGESINLENDTPENRVKYLVDMLGSKDYLKEFNQIKNRRTHDFFKTQNYMQLYDDIASEFIHFQKNQNITKLQQYMNEDVNKGINLLYNSITNPEDSAGAYALFGKLGKDLDDKALGASSFANFKEDILNLKQSNDLVSKMLERPEIANKLTENYPNNEVVGPFFDIVEQVNKSQILNINNIVTQEEGSINQEDLRRRLTLKLGKLRKSLENKHGENEVVEFVMEDLYEKMFTSSDSIFNQRENSPYATGSYFTELNKRKVDRVHETMNQFRTVLEDHLKDQQQQKVIAKHQPASAPAEVFFGDAFDRFSKGNEDVPIHHRHQEFLKMGIRDVDTTLKDYSTQEYIDMLFDIREDKKESMKRLANVLEDSILSDFTLDQHGQEQSIPGQSNIHQLEALISMMPLHSKSYEYDKQRGNIETLQYIAETLYKNQHSETHIEFSTIKRDLMQTERTFRNNVWKEYQLGVGQSVRSPEITSENLPNLEHTILKDLKDNINSFSEHSRDALKETKYINQNLKNNLFTKKDYVDRVLKDRPFNPAELVKQTSPYTMRTPLDMRHTTKHKKLLKTLVDDNANPYQQHYTLRNLSDVVEEQTGKKFDTFSQSLESYKDIRNKVNLKMGNVSEKDATRIDQYMWSAFDVEALSLDHTPKDIETVQVGAFGRNEQGNIQDFDMLVAGQTLNKFFTDLTGITQEEVDIHGEKSREVFQNFAEYAKGKGLLAHNLNYDLKHIQKGLENAGASIDSPMMDTLELSRKLYPLQVRQLENNTLTAVFEYLKEDIETNMIQEHGEDAAKEMLKNLQAHNARSDSEMTYLIAHQMIEELKENDIDHLEAIKHDYFMQRQERENMMKSGMISGTFDRSGELFNLDEGDSKYDLSAKNIQDQIDYMENVMKVDPDYIKKYRDKAILQSQVTDYNKFGTPSMMDNKMYKSASNLIGHDDEVIEFFEMARELKDVKGLNSTEGNYTLEYYNENLRNSETEERVQEYLETMRQYSDLEEDDVRKLYAYYERKRNEIPDFNEIDKEKFIDHQKGKVQKYTDIVKRQKQKHDRRKELLSQRGQFKSEKDSNKKISTVLKNIRDEEIEPYLKKLYKDVELDTSKLTEEVKAYRKANPNELDWSHPLVSKMKAYMGEAGEVTLKTNKKSQLEHIEKRLNSILRGKHQSIDIQGDLYDKHEELKQLIRKEVFEGVSTTKEQEAIVNQIRDQYSIEDISRAEQLLEEVNQLRIETHEDQDIEVGKIDNLNEVLKEKGISLDDYTIDFKQEWQEGQDEDLLDYNNTRQEIFTRIEQRKGEIQTQRDKMSQAFKEKYGYYNETEARKKSRELSEYLLEGDYESFRKEYTVGDPEEKIRRFEEEVLNKKKGQHTFKRYGERVWQEGEDGKPGRYVTTHEQFEMDQDNIFNYLSEKERYENWMKTETGELENELELELAGGQLENEFIEGTEKVSIPTDPSQIPRAKQLDRIEQFYNMDLQDIKSTFTSGEDLKQFLDEHEEYRLVSTVADDSKAARNPSQFFKKTMEDGSTETTRKDKFLHRPFTDLTQAEKELFEKGEFDKGKPAIKEMLYGNADELDDLFTEFDASEVSVGIMSNNDLKIAKEISYKPFELPGPLDFYYKNILRLQKSDVLVNSSWHPTNIIDMARKNSQMMDGIWQTDDYIHKMGEARDMYHTWHQEQRVMLDHFKELQGQLANASTDEEKKAILQSMHKFGEMGLDEYLKEIDKAEVINKLSDLPDDETHIGTQVYRKLKKSPSFKNLTEEEQVSRVNEMTEDKLNILKEVDAFQTSTATTDIPKFLDKMDEKRLGESNSMNRRMFRYLSMENPVMKTNMKVATEIEQVGRLHGYLLDRHLHGTSHDGALMQSLKRHFDYSDRSLPEMWGTMMFPFIAFPTRNALFWQKQLQDASLNRRYYHLMNAAWGRFDTQENEYAAAMKSKGYIPVGNTLVKVGDSRATALNMGTNFGDVAMSRLNPFLRAPLQALQDDDREMSQNLMEATPLLRRVPQMQRQVENIQDRGLSHKTLLPGVFGHIHDDSSHQRPVFRQRRNMYKQIFNQHGQYRQLSNNAYYRVRQLQNEQQRRRRR